MVRLTYNRLIMALVEHLDLELYYMNVQIAFLNTELDEEIYIDQPDGFLVSGQERKVDKLLSSIYGLK